MSRLTPSARSCTQAADEVTQMAAAELTSALKFMGSISVNAPAAAVDAARSAVAKAEAKLTVCVCRAPPPRTDSLDSRVRPL